MVRYHLHFTGRVQGVGFRWQARMAADTLRLTGWVMNMWDGSVDMEVQGSEGDIERMIEMLMRARYIEIDDIRKDKIAVCEDERSFKVKH